MPTAQGHWKNSSKINDLTMTKLASVTKKKKQDLLQKNTMNLSDQTCMQTSLEKIRKNILGRRFLDEDFHPSTNVFFMAIVIHVENLVIKLQNVARTIGTNIIPGDLSNMNLPGLNETSIDLKI